MSGYSGIGSAPGDYKKAPRQNPDHPYDRPMNIPQFNERTNHPNYTNDSDAFRFNPYPRVLPRMYLLHLGRTWRLYKDAAAHIWFLPHIPPFSKFKTLLSLIAPRPLDVVFKMFDEYIQSKLLRRLARFSCSIVRRLQCPNIWNMHLLTPANTCLAGIPDWRVPIWSFGRCTRDNTIPRRDRSKNMLLQLSLPSFVNWQAIESRWHGNHSVNCICQYTGSGFRIMPCHADWNATWSPQLHHHWKYLDHDRGCDTSGVLLSSSNYRGPCFVCMSLALYHLRFLSYLSRLTYWFNRVLELL